MSQNKKNNRIADMIEKAVKDNRDQHQRWKKALDLYKGKTVKFRESIAEGTVHQIEINVTKPVVDTMCPHLFFKSPQLRVTSPRIFSPPQIQDEMNKVSDDMNSIVEEIKVGLEYKKAIKDAILFGMGFVKTGISTNSEYQSTVPYSRRWSPFDFGVDPMCKETDLSDADYIYFKITENIKNFRQDKSLFKPGRIKPDSVADIDRGEDKDKPEDVEYASLYEVWDKSNKKVYLADKDGNIYKKQPWPQPIYPVSVIAFNVVPEQFWCMGEPDYLEVYQIEMSEKRTQWLNHTRRFNRKYRVSPSMSKDDQNALKYGGDGTVLVSRDDVQVIADAPMAGDVSKEIEMIKSEIQEITGIDAYKKSQGQKGVYTATEAQMIGSASDIQVGERKARIAEAFSHTGKILYMLMREQMGWPPLQFNFEVEMSSMSRPDDSQKRQDLIALAQNAQNFPEFKASAYLKDLAISLGKNPETYLKSPQEMQQQQPSPEQIKAQMDMQIAQQKAQMDMQMKQMEAQMKQQEMQLKALLGQKETESKLQLVDANMQLEQLKTQLEGARLQFDLQKMNAEANKDASV